MFAEFTSLLLTPEYPAGASLGLLVVLLNHDRALIIPLLFFLDLADLLLVSSRVTHDAFGSVRGGQKLFPQLPAINTLSPLHR